MQTPRRTEPLMNKPFEGVMILDLSRYLLGAYNSLYFADFGARVIKVEDTKSGDLCRQEFPQIDGESYYHYALDRNKESISLNLKDPGSLDAFYRLAAQADIVIENYRPGVAARLGVDYETLAKINPGIIYCSFSAYGQDNPLSLKPLHDINVVAETGFYDLNGGNVALLPPTDFASAMVGLQGILTALYSRQATGRGCHIDVSMLDSLVWWNAMLDSRWCFFGKNFPSSAREYPSVGYNIYRTKDDRMLAFGFYERVFWDKFCMDAGVPELQGTLKFTETEDPASYAAVKALVASKTYGEWKEWLQGKDHCITPVLDKTEAISKTMEVSPDVLGYVDFPRIGTVLQTNTPHKMGDVRADLSEAREPELLGQSTRSVLRELGLSDGAIDEMAQRGAVRLCDQDQARVSAEEQCDLPASAAAVVAA